MPPSQKTFCASSRTLTVALSQSCSDGDRSVVNEFLKKIATGDKTDILKTEPFNGCVEYLRRMRRKQ